MLLLLVVMAEVVLLCERMAEEQLQYCQSRLRSRYHWKRRKREQHSRQWLTVAPKFLVSHRTNRVHSWICWTLISPSPMLRNYLVGRKICRFRLRLFSSYDGKKRFTTNCFICYWPTEWNKRCGFIGRKYLFRA